MLLTKGKTDCDPMEVGYEKEREDVLIQHFQNLIDQHKVQCASYCVSRKGKVILHGAVGPRSFEEGCTEPLLPDSVHEIASITKTFTAVALMQLIEDGKARLDNLVGDILPQFKQPPFHEITLFQLLTHTSGIAPDPHVFPDAYSFPAWEYIEMLYKQCEKKEEFDWLTAGLATGMTQKPGVQWQYCSFGFAILGAVIEKLSGQFANDYIEQHILKPLGMNDSGFILRKEMAAKAIYRNERKKKMCQEIVAGTRSGYEDEGTMWEKIPDTAGGMCASACDLVRFGNMMLGHGRLEGVRILGRKTVEKMTTYSLHNIPDYCWAARESDRQYGIGFDMRKGMGYHYSEGTYMHEGAGACSLIIDPVEEMVAAWFVPFTQDNWFSEGLYNVNNIIWSGLI